jgi:ABC-type Fe3+/spermidine/putrescine transport system ATPase subunit
MKIENLSKKFDKRGIQGVHGVSFNLQRGEVLAIIGPNGGGKTTLLKMLSGELRPDRGLIEAEETVTSFTSTYGGKDENVQNFLTNSITLDVDHEKKIQLARDLADTFEFTFGLRQNLSQLSSGQLQKVLLARELINRPNVLLLDEPFAHLDPFTRGNILKDLFKYLRQQETSVIWVTHDLTEAFRHSDSIAVMNLGKFEHYGSAYKLIKEPQNLFVASYIGYRNFVPVKYQDNHWETPWGPLDAPPLNKPDGILVIPDHSWEFSGNVQVKVLEKEIVFQGQIMHFQVGHLRFQMFAPICYTLPDPNSPVLLSPKFSECFLIPL